MKGKIITTLLSLMLMQMMLVACGNLKTKAPLVGRIDNDSISLLISKEKIQTGLNSLLTPSKQDFLVYTVDIIKYQNRYFLKVIGVDNQKCMIALKEKKGKLYELNDHSIPIAICVGCEEGCEPNLTEDGWYCSDGCSDCYSAITISDHYVFN